jgi:hypothetical protein
MITAGNDRFWTTGHGPRRIFLTCRFGGTPAAFSGKPAQSARPAFRDGYHAPSPTGRNGMQGKPLAEQRLSFGTKRG